LREIAAAGSEEIAGDYSPAPMGDYSPSEQFESDYSPMDNYSPGEQFESAHSPHAEGAYSPPSDYSPSPVDDCSPLTAGDYSPKPELLGELIDIAEFKAKVTSHPSAIFDDKKWKRSRVKLGQLIARVQGYDLVESEYGVNYLKVLKRRPKRTSGDYSLHEHAGFFTWRALQAGGRLAKEKKRNERLNVDRTHAS
jgi:hypothetical protein